MVGVTVCSPDPLEPRPCCCWSQCDGTPAGHPGLSVQPAALGGGNSRRQAISECSCNKDPMPRDSELVLCQYGGSVELSSQAAQGLCSGGEARCHNRAVCSFWLFCFQAGDVSKARCCPHLSLRDRSPSPRARVISLSLPSCPVQPHCPHRRTELVGPICQLKV